MADPAFDARRAGVRPEHVEEFERLQCLLRHAPGFLLIFADVAWPAYRDFLISRLDESLPQPGCSAARIDLALGQGPADFDALESALLVLPADCRIVHLLNADAWLDAGQITALNLRRDALAANLPRVLLWWLPTAVIERIALQAPDAWSWRGGVFDFSTPAESLSASPAVWMRDDLRMSLAERQARIAELRLQITPAVPLSIRISLLLELTRLLESVGAVDEAIDILRQQALPLAEPAGNACLLAEIQSAIADVLVLRGQLDEALRIRREEELPVYERLGDVREKAVTQGKIADILQMRGQLDEALRIRREEELPVYERLGDVRAKAVTQGQIADILQMRGQLDEALRIYCEDVLTVFEHLGDVHQKATVQGRIADILQARGQLDEALAIHEGRLAIARQMQNSDSIGHALWSIANIRLHRGDHQQAAGFQEIFAALSEAFALYRQIGRLDGIAAIGNLLAQVMLMGGLKNEVPAVLDATESAYRTLGNTDGIAFVQQLRELLAQLP